MISEKENERSNRWLSTLLIKNTSKVKPLDIVEELEKDNIEARMIWKPMHMQPIFKKYDFIKAEDKISVGEDLFTRGVCLPSDTKMSNKDLEREL